jgi:cytosine/creatinine deaminase
MARERGAAGALAVTDGPKLRIAKAHVPLCLLDADFADAGSHLALVDLDVAGGRVTGISAAGSAPASHDAALIDQAGGQVWPGLIDLHTHLDKGHIWPRAANPDGTFDAALEAVRGDRAANWSADDVRARFEFGLRCAFAHGTVAIRTHLDSPPPQHRITWPLFGELRAQWADRITLQAVSLVSLADLRGAFAEELADLVAQYRGVFGCATSMLPDIDRQLDRAFALAAERGLDLDFHVD